MNIKTLMPILFVFIFSLVFSPAVLAGRSSNHNSNANSNKQTPTTTNTSSNRGNPNADKLEEKRQDVKQRIENKKEEVQQKREEKRQEIQERKEERTQQRCEQVSQRVTNRITSFENNIDTHIRNYLAAKDRIMEVVTKLNDLGLDTTVVEGHLVEYEALVQEYADSYALFIETLVEAQDLPCGESEGDYKSLIQEARQELLGSRSMRQEIRLYYAQVLRKDLADLRQQGSDLLSNYDSDTQELEDENTESTESQEVSTNE